MAEPLKFIVAGCGSRGTTYSKLLKNCSDRATVVGVADPREFYRNQIGDMFNIPSECRYRDWSELASRPKFADAVIIATPDAVHEDPAIAFAGLGYNILLEKPLAPTEEASRRIIGACKKAGTIFAVCHVLRYTPYTRLLKKTLDSGVIGKVINIQHIEPVLFWHQCHSFVRGNWRNTAESSCMLLQKCCHDLDWIRYLMGRSCMRVQSFGSLSYFTRENQPKGAADRCIDCPPEIENFCNASALKIYARDRVAKGNRGWPTVVVTPDPTPENLIEALRTGPYGRCAFACDNDVVDHQVVNMEFDDASTAQMTMTAFACGNRSTRISGTRGEILGDSVFVKVHDYYTNTVTTLDSENRAGGTAAEGHGGGDGGVMEAFLKALETGDRSSILSGADESLESHLMVFSAEKSRLNGMVEKIEH